MVLRDLRHLQHAESFPAAQRGPATAGPTNSCSQAQQANQAGKYGDAIRFASTKASR